MGWSRVGHPPTLIWLEDVIGTGATRHPVHGLVEGGAPAAVLI